MPKIRYYDDVKIIKKPFKKRFFKFISFFCIVVVFAFCIVVSNYFSNALTVSGSFSNLIYGNTSIKRPAKKYYAVVLGEYNTLEDAEKVSLGAIVQGASGFIWSEEKHYVIGSMYFNKEDAEKVLNNLKDSQYNTTIKEIDISKIEISFDDYENKQVRKIEEVFEYIDSLINSFYTYSIDFDKGITNNLAISTNISNLRGNCKVLISEIQNYLNISNNKLQIIQNTLIKIDQLLNEAILKTIDNTATGYFLKNTMSSLIRLEYDLGLSLKNS